MAEQLVGTASNVPAASETASPPVVNIDKPLTKKELQALVTLRSAELIGELYQLAQRQVQAEVGRQTRLDAKATSLLTAAGLSLTVAFTFGATLISPAGEHIFHHWHDYLVTFFAIAVTLGLVAAWYAVRALLAQRTYLAMNERTVFHPETLKEADDADDEDEGLKEYRKLLIVDLWLISQQQERNHNQKAEIIALGQKFFMGFLAALFGICLFVVLGISSPHAQTPGEAPQGQSGSKAHP